MTRRIPLALPWLAGLLAIYLIAPLIAGARQVGLADWNSVDTAALLHASAISVASATVATAIIALGGIPLGYLLARVPGRGMAALGFLVQLPLALPPLASGILLLFLVGYASPLGRLTAGALTDTFVGIVLAEVFVAAPFLIIAARSGFASIDPVLEGVAATLGRGRLYVFFRVSMPMAWPTILSGLLLSWLRAFGEFGATVMVAYHPYSLPIYTYVAFGSQGLPAMLPVLLPTLAFALAIMVLSSVAGSRARAQRLAVSSIEDVPAAPEFPAKSAVAAGPANLNFELEKRLGGFRLGVAWSPQLRRLAILGPSGSGKSMTLKMIAGIEGSDRGRVVLDGKTISALDPAARGIAYVPQNYGLFPHLSVAEQLAFPLGSEPATAKRWIERFGLNGLEQRRPDALSLGQQQRVALARALVRPAKLLLLDEPFSALDAPLRSQLRQEMLALQAEFGITTILVTHDPAEAALLADELLLLEGGRVLQSGPTDQVFSRPASETAARLLGAETIADGAVVDPETIAIGAGVLLKVAAPPLQPGSQVGWSVPAARVRLGKLGRYQGRIEAIVPVGVERRIAIGFGKALIHAMAGGGELSVGNACRFDIDPDAVRVWPLFERPRSDTPTPVTQATPTDTIKLYAAGSLRTALTDAAKAFEANTGHRVHTKFGPSGLLKDEIAAGARAHVFASANMQHPQALTDIDKSGPVLLFARNKLCALVRPFLNVDGTTLLDRMLEPAIKLGTSTPGADPSGDYAFEVFRKADAISPGARAALEAKARKLTGNATSAVPPPGTAIYGWHVAEGRADIFLCYRTAAEEALKQFPGQRIVELPEPLAVGADYGLTVIAGAPAAAQLFAEFIGSPVGQEILIGHGFASGQNKE